MKSKSIIEDEFKGLFKKAQEEYENFEGYEDEAYELVNVFKKFFDASFELEDCIRPLKESSNSRERNLGNELFVCVGKIYDACHSNINKSFWDFYDENY